jgi:uncharacterized protein
VEYEAGESVRVEVHGVSPLLRGEFEMNNPFAEMTSRGAHRVHIRGDFPSHVVPPFV